MPVGPKATKHEEKPKTKNVYLKDIQWNLSIADMLYSGHLSIANTFYRNQLSQAMVKTLYFKPLYSGHLSIADTYSENQWCPQLRGFTVFIEIQCI